MIRPRRRLVLIGLLILVFLGIGYNIDLKTTRVDIAFQKIIDLQWFNGSLFRSLNHSDEHFNLEDPITDNNHFKGNVTLNISHGNMNRSNVNFELKDESEINDIVLTISKLTQIRLESSYMKIVKASLRKLSQLPRIPPDLVKKSNESVFSTVVPPCLRVEYEETSGGHRLPIITCQPLGRLGNVMGEYATIFALQHLYNVSVVLNSQMRRCLFMFPNLSLSSPTDFDRKEWKTIGTAGSLYNYSPIELAASGLLGPHKFIIAETALEIQLFHNFKKQLQQEFSVSASVKTKVDGLLRDILKKRESMNKLDTDAVFIGFHVRRTDYANHFKRFGSELPGDKYFNRAIEYYRKKFPKTAIFIAASDDYIFLKNSLGKNPDVFFSSGDSAYFDMAVLAACNHSIITLGSFGFWTGFLAGGEVVYPDVKLKRSYRFSKSMYEKIGLSSFTPIPVD